MTSPQIQRLQDVYNIPVLDSTALDEFLNQPEYQVLFFAGDPDKYPEANDVAMVLPELLTSFPQLRGALIAPESAAELQPRFNFTRWPTLVFLQQGKLLGNISQIQNWEDYQLQISHLLHGDPVTLISGSA